MSPLTIDSIVLCLVGLNRTPVLVVYCKTKHRLQQPRYWVTSVCNDNDVTDKLNAE